MRALFFTMALWHLAAIAATAQGRYNTTITSRIDLGEKDWLIQSSAQTPQRGEEISSGNFTPIGWQPARVPTTVVAALVKNGVYTDPYFGMNLRSIPGTTYGIGDNFSIIPMQPDSPFAVSWWYRTQFRLPAQGIRVPSPSNISGRRLWLNFDSINYRANIWLNGRQIAASDKIRGMYRMFEFDISDIAVPGLNTLAVEVFAPTEKDLSITFVDWNPMPPDKDMGLVRNVYILTSGPVTVRNVQVVTRLNDTLDEARLTIYADLKNSSSQEVAGVFEGSIGDIAVSANIRLAAGKSTTVTLNPDSHPQLRIRDPQLWWPIGLGAQTLHRLHAQFRLGGMVSDQQDVQFGIREFTSELDRQHRVFRINGKRILIRGGGWTHDMLLRVDDEREENELRYVREMNLNAIRLEGKMLNERLFDLADRYGILIMPGWCCCDYWEQWGRWETEHYEVARESMRDQLRRLRNHASVFVFLYGSDAAPDAQAERMYLDVLAEERWPHPYLSAARDSTTVGAGLTGVKMNGPYDYVPPNYWLTDTQWGGAWGFNTEVSPGHAIPVLPSLRQMLPANHLWTLDEFWNFHAASPSYPDINVFTAAMDARYGKAKDLEDFAKKGQVMAYEGERAMFEAFGRNKYTATGIIQWMLNNAWPSIVWHLYDYYLRPGGGYFGAKKANERIHVQYSYDDRSVVVVNSLYGDFPGYSVTAKIYNFDMTEKFSRTTKVDITEDSSTRVFLLPMMPDFSRTYFVHLALNDADGKLVSRNFYWLSTQPDVIDTASQTHFSYTPVKTHADLTDLEKLPPVKLAMTWRSEDNGPERTEYIAVRNPSSQLAFFVHLSVSTDTDGTDLAPVFWEDNYLELLPGEERQITARYASKLLGGAQSRIQVDGWNVVP